MSLVLLHTLNLNLALEKMAHTCVPKHFGAQAQMTLKRTDFHGFFILLFFICEHLFVSVFFCVQIFSPMVLMQD